MRKNTFAVLMLIVFSLCLVQNAYSQVSGEIAIIKTAGNRGISTAEILSKVQSRTGEMFDLDAVNEDTKRIAQLDGVEYSYYNTEIIDNKVHLTFVVVEKNVIRKIVFIGNSNVKTKTLRKKLGLTIGKFLDVAQINTGAETLEDFYHKKGYAFATVAADKENLSLGKVVYRIDEGKRVRITSIKFSGNKAYSAGKLSKVVKTKKNKWLIAKAYYNEQKVNNDQQKIKSVYYERGFLNVEVAAKLKFNSDKSKVVVIFVIDEGNAYGVESIAIIGNQQLEKSQLLSEIKLQQGKVYNEKTAVADIWRLAKLYHENGFIDVRVEKNVKFISSNKVVVDFIVTEGQRFRIGRVDITGNEQTQDKVIRRILDEYDFQPGKWYNADIARGNGSGSLEKKIKTMAMTDAATITPAGQTPGQRDAQVSVVEGQTGMVMLGAGVASDSGVMGQVIFEQRNFDIKDWPESFGEFITGKAFKGAGQNFRISLQPGTEVSQYSIDFTEPYFKDKPIAMNVSALSRQWERECYDEKRTRGYIGFEKRYKNNWRRSIGFRAENVDVDSVESNAPTEIKDVKGSNAFAAVKLGVARDMTDSRLNPSKGYGFELSYEQAGGDHTFGVLSGTYRKYKTLYEDLAERKTILAAKIHAATTVGDAPPFEKFYAGGSRSIRGFEYRGVSTRGRNTSTNKLDDPIGSDWLLLASAEVTVPLISDNFAALFFVDTGAIDSGNCRASVGTGIQIMIPQWFGPVPMRFEIAAPIMKDSEDETQTFSFSVGRLF